MGIKNVKFSDISGAELKDDDTLRVIVRGHPKVGEDKQLDAATGELDALKTVANLVAVEIQYPDGTSKEVAATATELEKIIPLDVLQNADGLRGRRKNFRPSQD
ncbi:MAG: hypothetical protein WA972_05935 [Rhodococcus qingshengii]